MLDVLRHKIKPSYLTKVEMFRNFFSYRHVCLCVTNLKQIVYHEIVCLSPGEKSA